MAAPGAAPRPEPDRIARAVLSRIGETGDPRLTRLVTELGAEMVLEGLRSQDAVGSGGLGGDLAERLRAVDGRAELARADELGIRFVVPGDEEWPVGLDDLEHGPVLHQRGGIPVGLWVKGPLQLDESCRRSVAIVGSRSATSYGADAAGEIAATVATAGFAVVSGAAFGIDQAAHRGALAVRRPTVAVLACGVDRAYPTAHRPLLDYIAEVGLVVSEAPPGGAPTRIRFLARNRLIAATTNGTVVVEAAVRSGALNTAGWAAGVGRIVMGLPGPVTSAPSAGVHQLIRARDALLVTSGAEVLEAVGPAGSFTLEEPREDPTPRDLLSPQERQVLDAVPVQHAVDPDRIARTAGLHPDRARDALARLLAAGLVEHARGRWRLTKEAANVAPTERGESGFVR
ncbi:MAG: DNA-processing protein DprA [Actinomycetota bacterium]|nr:DNA-processing protein DprA [Actinomycetota bacterium]